jgi:hypothetical protein
MSWKRYGRSRSSGRSQHRFCPISLPAHDPGRRQDSGRGSEPIRPGASSSTGAGRSLAIPYGPQEGHTPYRPGWRNGRRWGLKIPRPSRACGFDSHPRHQGFMRVYDGCSLGGIGRHRARSEPFGGRAARLSDPIQGRHQGLIRQVGVPLDHRQSLVSKDLGDLRQGHVGHRQPGRGGASHESASRSAGLPRSDPIPGP